MTEAIDENVDWKSIGGMSTSINNVKECVVSPRYDRNPVKPPSFLLSPLRFLSDELSFPLRFVQLKRWVSQNPRDFRDETHQHLDFVERDLVGNFENISFFKINVDLKLVFVISSSSRKL